MKKPILVLSTILCFGAIRMSVAQPNAPTYEQTLARTKQSLVSKDYAEAERNAQKTLALATSPEEKSLALIALGESFYKRKMFTQATTQWNQAAALDDTESRDVQTLVHFALARSYAMQGDPDKAVAECNAASDILNANPDFNEERKNSTRTVFALLVADAYFRAPQLDAAKEQFTQILEENEDKPNPSSVALFKLGQIEFIRVNYHDALERFEQVLKVEDADEDIKQQARIQIKALTTLLPREAEFKDPKNHIKFELENIDQTVIEDLIDQMVLDSF